MTPNRRWLILGAIVVAVEALYLFVVSAGKLFDWPTYLSYFDFLAEGFRSGHLHLSITPAPELLAASDPFDPELEDYWAPDVSYYKGQYYLYWGPVPALLLAAVKISFRISAPIGDQHLIFAFYSLQVLFGALLLERMSRRLLDGVRFRWLALGLVTFALSTPTPHSLANGGVYNTAIAAGQAFLLGGVLFAFDAVSAAGSGIIPRGKLLAVGLFWALAVGSRITLAPSVFLLSLVTSFATREAPDRRWSTVVRDLLWLGALPVLGLGALLLYNKLRFNAWTDFGGTRQLSTLRFKISSAFFPANLYSYLLRPMVVGCQFPFITAPWSLGPRAFPRGMTLAPDYWAEEPLVGILPGLPVAWLGLAALVGGVSLLRAARAQGGAPLGPGGRLFLWCVASFAILATNSAFPVLFLFMPSMRQLGDVNTGLVMLGILGTWWLLFRFRDRPVHRRLIAALAISLAAATIVTGVLLGYEGYNQHFHEANPELDARLTRKLSVCR